MHPICPPGCRIALIGVDASPLAPAGSVDAASRCTQLAHLARALAHSGIAIDIFTRRSAPQQAEVVHWQDGIRVIHVPAGPPQPVPQQALLPHMTAFARWVARFVGRQPALPDLAHATCFASGMAALHLKRVLGLPFAITFHTLGRAPRLVSGAAATGLAERFGSEAALMREAGRIVATCPQDRRDIDKLYGVAAARIAVLRHGFSPSEFWPVASPEARRRLAVDPARFTVLQLGQMAPRNGIDTVIQGLAMLRQNHGVDAALLVVGGEQRSHPSDTPGRRRDGAELARMRQLARELGVAQHVRFAGHQPRHALRDYYAAADVFASTPWYAPCGITPVEAMACARPVIASAVGDIDAMVDDGATGYLVPARAPEALAERLAQLQRRPALARAMGEAGRARAHDCFTWQRVAQRMVAVYRDVLGEARAGHPYPRDGADLAGTAAPVDAALSRAMSPSIQP